MKVYTIGFTQKKAQDFYEAIKKFNIQLVVDVRLNHSSQLAGFSKYPDIVYFLRQICNTDYRHDLHFAPTENLLKNYKKGTASWDDYVKEFSITMEQRKISDYILKEYETFQDQSICLLCSEPTPEKCHRRLVAEHFQKVLGAEIIHI